MADGTTPGIAPEQDSLDPGQAGNAVAFNNVKTFGDIGPMLMARMMRQAAQDDDLLAKDAIDERRGWSAIRQATAVRAVSHILGTPMESAASEQMLGASGDLSSKIANIESLVAGMGAGNQGLAAGQQSAKIAQSTAPETGILGQLVQANAVAGQQMTTMIQQLTSLSAAVEALVQVLNTPTPAPKA
jgi:hypothetical protein